MVKGKFAVAALIDKLGEIKAEISALNDLEEEYKAKLIAAGVDDADGELFHATVSRYKEKRVDWKALRKEYHPPKFLEAIKAHTKENPKVVVRVFARKS